MFWQDYHVTIIDTQDGCMCCMGVATDTVLLLQFHQILFVILYINFML